MALINLQSQLDLVQGTEPVGNMSGQIGPTFDLGPNSIFQIDSLINQYQYNYGNTSDSVGPSTLDLNGVDYGNGIFDFGPNSTFQQDSLASIPLGQYADLNGLPGPPFDNGPEPGGVFNLIDTLHEQSLTSNYSYQYGNSIANVNATTLDLNGFQGPNFDLGTNSTLHNADSLLNYYQYINPTLIPISPSSLDLNGEQPDNFDLGADSTFHNPDSLLEQYQYSYGAGNNPFNNSTAQTGPSNLDLNGVSTLGEATWDQGTNSTIHNPDSLLQLYQYSYGAGNNPFNNSTAQTGPSNLDLDGVSTIGEATFDNGMNSDLHINLLQNQYISNINPGASYGQGQPGATWPTLNPAPILGGGFADLDGGLPPNGGYVNPETGTTY